MTALRRLCVPASFTSQAKPSPAGCSLIKRPRNFSISMGNLISYCSSPESRHVGSRPILFASYMPSPPPSQRGVEYQCAQQKRTLGPPVPDEPTCSCRPMLLSCKAAKEVALFQQQLAHGDMLPHMRGVASGLLMAPKLSRMEGRTVQMRRACNRCGSTGITDKWAEPEQTLLTLGAR